MTSSFSGYAVRTQKKGELLPEPESLFPSGWICRGGAVTIPATGPWVGGEEKLAREYYDSIILAVWGDVNYKDLIEYRSDFTTFGKPQFRIIHCEGRPDHSARPDPYKFWDQWVKKELSKYAGYGDGPLYKLVKDKGWIYDAFLAGWNAAKAGEQ